MRRIGPQPDCRQGVATDPSRTGARSTWSRPLRTPCAGSTSGTSTARRIARRSTASPGACTSRTRRDSTCWSTPALSGFVGHGRLHPFLQPRALPRADRQGGAGGRVRRPVRGHPAAVSAAEEPDTGSARTLQLGPHEAGHPGRAARRTIGPAQPCGVPQVLTADHQPP